MIDVHHEIKMVTPGLNFLEAQGDGAKSVIERTKKALQEAADRIDVLEKALAKIAGRNSYWEKTKIVPINVEIDEIALTALNGKGRTYD